MNDKDFNKRIGEIRKNKGLSQNELANLSGLSLRTIQRIENGETNPIGDTKRKIIKVLNSYSKTDLRGEPKEKEKEKNNLLQKVMIKYEYSVILFIFSILLFSVALSGVKWAFYLSYTIGLLSIILLIISTNYQLKLKGFKKGVKYITTCLSAVIIYLFSMSLWLPAKRTTITTINGVGTKIEKNLLTGKSDTTIIKNQRINLKNKYKASP